MIMTAERAWEMVRHLFPKLRLSDFREVVIPLTFSGQASETVSQPTPVRIPAGAIIYRIQGSGDSDTAGEDLSMVRVQAQWPDGTAIIANGRVGAVALFGPLNNIQFPGIPLIVPPAGQINWTLENTSGASVTFEIIHRCLVPRSAGA